MSKLKHKGLLELITLLRNRNSSNPYMAPCNKNVHYKWLEELLTSDYDFLLRYDVDMLLKKHGYVYKGESTESTEDVNIENIKSVESLSKDMYDEICI